MNTNKSLSERVPQDAFSGSIVLRSANRSGGLLSSCSGTRHSILRCVKTK